ncbi:MAG TPA: serine hydrolase [Pyrinomonadaceae bacterium]|nr:serine hydrolase [Pyrinomonadaceae bacterium]
MKSRLGSVCLLLILAIQPFSHAVLAQTLPSDKTGSDPISLVENSLLPAVLIKGEPVSTMNLAERMKHYNVKGVSVAVINNGKIEWAKGYGVRDVDGNLPVTVDTIFQAGSVSKPVAAMAALKMVQDGKLSLDQDVNLKLVSWKMPDNEFTTEQKVTLRGLLSHSAGTSIWGFGGYPADSKSLPTVPQILDGSAPANTKPVRVVERPGTKWSYSGGGFTVMQLLLTDVSKKPFPELMDETVLKKLDMKHSTYQQLLPPDLLAYAAIGYAPNGQRPPFKWFIHPEMAAAGLWTTPSDLARFAIELQQAYAGKSKKILSREMVKQMLTKQTGGWGLGITVIGDGPKALRFSHGGANTGFRTRLLAYASTGQGAIVMTNGEQGDALCAEILRGIAKVYGWADYLAEKTIAQVDVQKFGDYAGDYEFNGVKYSILIEDGKLIVKNPNGAKFELLAESETKFFLRERAAEFVFVKDASGRVTELVLYSNGQELKFKKL